MKLERPRNQASKAWRLTFLVYHVHHVVMIIFSHHSQIFTALPVCCSACFFAFSGVSSDFKPSSISADTAEQLSLAVHPLPEAALFHASIWVPLGTNWESCLPSMPCPSTQMPKSCLILPCSTWVLSLQCHRFPAWRTIRLPGNGMICREFGPAWMWRADSTWCVPLTTDTTWATSAAEATRLTKCSWLPLLLCV